LNPHLESCRTSIVHLEAVAGQNEMGGRHRKAFRVRDMAFRVLRAHLTPPKKLVMALYAPLKFVPGCRAKERDT